MLNPPTAGSSHPIRILLINFLLPCLNTHLFGRLLGLAATPFRSVVATIAGFAITSLVKSEVFTAQLKGFRHRCDSCWRNSDHPVRRQGSVRSMGPGSGPSGQSIMNRLTRLDSLDPSPDRSQRRSSISSDRASLSVASLPVPPAVSPDPAYIEPASAFRIVTGDLGPTFQEGEGGEERPGAVNITVAPNALYLVNAFLDQLLYSFLASSRSTSIASLRPAVTEVLKPRIAKDAVASADRELEAFLGAGDEEGLEAFHSGLESKGDWHLNTIWRRTRLRCMVYTRLGDLEKEDEEMWIERENAQHQAAGHHRLSRDLGVVSPAAAIFLTSILEFIGEQVLLLSAESAYARFEARRRQEKHSSASVIGIQPPSVEVVDIEKLALNTTFGRLWRSWKKRVRSPSNTSPRPPSCEYLLRPPSSHSMSGTRSRHASIGEIGEYDLHPDPLRELRVPEHLERSRQAAVVPLPASRDGTPETREPDSATQNYRQGPKGRPRSMMMAAFDSSYLANQPNATMNRSGTRPRLLQHNRSSSLPHLSYRQLPSSPEGLSSTPREGPFSAAFEDSRSRYSRYDSDRAVVTTIYDGAIEESAMGGSEDLAGHHSDLSVPKQSGKDIKNLDDGLDSLAEASNQSQPLDGEVPGDAASTSGGNNDSQYLSQRPDAVHISRATSHAVGPSEVQQIPPRVESRVDSPRMQGYTTENVSLENRETSIVETAPAQALRHSKASDIPNVRPSHSDNGVVEYASNGINGSVPYTSRDQFDRAVSTTKGVSGEDYGPSNRFQPDSSAKTGAVDYGSSPTLPQAKTSAKVLDIRKQLPPVRTGIERASVQRVSPSPGSALESPVGRTSTSSSRDVRLIHTSGSNTSQRATKPRNLAGRESSDLSRQFAVSRGSSEGSVNGATSAAQRPSVDETQRSFEQLIKSDETIQYTLTPQSVREMDVSSDSQ